MNFLHLPSQCGILLEFPTEHLLQLLSAKTIIYATHNLRFMEAAELEMKNGHIEIARHIAAYRRSLSGVKPHHQRKCQLLFLNLQIGSNYWFVWTTEESKSSMDQSTISLIQLLNFILLVSEVASQVFRLFVDVLAISIWYQRYYINTARELTRMVRIRKAPILHQFSETVVGATIVHCFNQEDRFLTKTLNLIDDYTRVVFHNSASMEWLCLRVNFMGERRMNLSGGQKKMIQLARAIYNNADVYFLDDPFGFVDACTGTHLFKRCLLQLLSAKTMYATHNLEFIEAADLILVMKNGEIVESGN